MTDRVEVLSQWGTRASPGGGLDNIPQVVLDHPSIEGWVETSANPMDNGNIAPDPDSTTISIEGSVATIDAVLLDPNYPLMPGTRETF